MSEKLKMTNINNWTWSKNIFTIYYFLQCQTLCSDRKNTLSHYWITIGKQGLAYIFLVMFNMLMFIVVNFLVLFTKFRSYQFGHVSIPQPKFFVITFSHNIKIVHAHFHLFIQSYCIDMSLKNFSRWKLKLLNQLH